MQTERKTHPPRLEKPLRITEQVWPEGTAPVVSIWCPTYNHVKFIRDAIEGFLMQETTFPVEIFIHDDASTDGTKDILRHYSQSHPQLIRTALQHENQMSRGNLKSILNELWLRPGEFIAFCEGDDFWTDSQKLELQYSYLSQQTQTNIACTRYTVLEADTFCEIEPFSKAWRTDVLNVTRSNWLNPYVLMTCTAMVRGASLRRARDQIRSFRHFKDIFLWRLLLSDGDAVVLPQRTAVYRKHPGGIFSLLSQEKMHESNLMTAASMLRHFGPQEDDVVAYFNGTLASYQQLLKKKGRYGKLCGVGVNALATRLRALLSQQLRKGEALFTRLKNLSFHSYRY